MKLDIYRDIIDPDLLHLVQASDIAWTVDLSTVDCDMLDIGYQLEQGENPDTLTVHSIEYLIHLLEPKPIASYQEDQVTLFVMADILTNAERTFLGWS